MQKAPVDAFSALRHGYFFRFAPVGALSALRRWALSPPCAMGASSALRHGRFFRLFKREIDRKPSATAGQKGLSVMRNVVISSNKNRALSGRGFFVLAFSKLCYMHRRIIDRRFLKDKPLRFPSARSPRTARGGRPFESGCRCSCNKPRSSRRKYPTQPFALR